MAIRLQVVLFAEPFVPLRLVSDAAAERVGRRGLSEYLDVGLHRFLGRLANAELQIIGRIAWLPPVIGIGAAVVEEWVAADPIRARLTNHGCERHIAVI